MNNSPNNDNKDSDKKIILPDTEQLIISSSPHLHDNSSVRKIMLTVIISLLPACMAGIFLFGINALKVILLCTFFCVVTEFICCRFFNTSDSDAWKDGSAVVTGILLAMNLNAGVPWWICLVGSLFAIVIAKQIFGGIGFNPFNPALVARVALLIGFPKIMTTWMKPMPGVFFSDPAVTQATPLGIVKEVVKQQSNVPLEQSIGGMLTPHYYWDWFIGKVGGCLGETSVLALLAGGVFLIIMKLIRWQVPVAYIGTVALFTAIVHFAGGPTPGPLFHILTGGLFLGAFFMATDMVTSPMTKTGALIFGIGCGIVTCIIRIWGNYPEGVSFSILFMNALVPLIDRFTAKKTFGFQKSVSQK